LSSKENLVQSYYKKKKKQLDILADYKVNKGRIFVDCIINTYRVKGRTFDGVGSTRFLSREGTEKKEEQDYDDDEEEEAGATRD
jgi:hypothetical protein